MWRISPRKQPELNRTEPVKNLVQRKRTDLSRLEPDALGRGRQERQVG